MMDTKQRTFARWTAALIAVATLTAAPSAAQGPPHQAYVANRNANTVSVIDTATNAVAATLAVGTSPEEVAISGDGTRAYVINTGSHSLSVIDTAAQAVIATIALGDEPSGLAVSPAGDRVYVLGATGLFAVIDANRILEPDSPIIASFVVGQSGGELAVAPDGKRVYIASGALWVVDAQTNTLLPDCSPPLGVLGVNTFAVAVAVSPDGKRAYVSVVTYWIDLFGFQADGGIKVVDLATNQVTSTIRLFSQPGAVVFTADGSRAYATIRSYWANTGYGAAFLPGRWVATIDTATNAVVKWIDLGAGAVAAQPFTPAGIAVTPDRTRVYVAMPATGSVAAVDLATNAVSEYILVAGGPSGVATVPDAAAIPRPYHVDAVDDLATSTVAALAGGIAVDNVLANDTVDDAPAAVGNVTLSLVAADSAGITLDTASGALGVSAGTPAGSYTATYRICEAGNPDNCDDAIVTLSVRARYPLLAFPDGADAVAGTLAVASVLGNDTLNDATASLATVSVALVEGDAGLRLDPAAGSVHVTDAASAGMHALVYSVCEIADPANCDRATVTVLVSLPQIVATGDAATAPRTGSTAIVNVLANDTLDGSAATLARVRLVSVSATAAGLTLNVATGAVSVAAGTTAGVQSLVYRICEIVRPGNCSDTAVVTVTVAQYVVTAVADAARASSKNAATAVVNVLANDSIGGVRASAANVKLALVSLSPSNPQIRMNADGTVDVLAKSSGGTYSLAYEICETGNPGNCARATLRLDLSGKM